MSKIKDLIKLPVTWDKSERWIIDVNGDVVHIDSASPVGNFIADAINNYERLEKENAELNKILDEASKQYPVILDYGAIVGKRINNMDLVYFDYNEEQKTQFKDEIVQAFPDAVLEDADDDYKGYRWSVEKTHTDRFDKDVYMAWLIGNGWMEASLMFGLLAHSDNEYIVKCIAQAKAEYPHNFKK